MQATEGRGRRFGDVLIDHGLVDRAEVERAVWVQEGTGSRLGEVLRDAGVIDDRQVAFAYAAHRGLALFDPGRDQLDVEAVELLPEAVARKFRLVPLSLKGGELVVAAENDLSEAAAQELRRHTEHPVRVVVASRADMDALRRTAYADHHLELAATDLVHRAPEESAFRVVTGRQKAVLLALAMLAVALVVRDAIGAVVLFNILAVGFYSCFSLFKLVTVIRASGRDAQLVVSDEDVDRLDESTLPVYTILMPLYHETSVLRRLVASVDRLDYPPTKLDVRLLLEEDDVDTIRAAEAMDLAAHFRLVVIPDGLPKTKPRACNFGLLQAEGEFVVVYDAEDIPDPDQLKKAVIAFRKAGSEVHCVQCKLNYFNAEQNLLTRWFTNEYSMWFDLFMPGLDTAGVPVPLGGTSNHFYTESLLALGAWDPFNVTEDADLGIRLHKHGMKTVVLDSTTYEEANSRVGNWLRQRSRWTKGYIQTWLVHMRHPVDLWRQLGPKGWCAFQMVIGGTFFGTLLNPLYWLLSVAWVLTQFGVIREIFPGFLYFMASAGLVLGNFAFVYANVLGSVEHGHPGLAKYALLSPVYWVLMSIGAWKGLLQLFFKPFYWEKTVHGLDSRDGGTIGELPSAHGSFAWQDAA